MSFKVKKFWDKSQVDEEDHEIEDMIGQYEKEADEIENLRGDLE